MSTAALSPLGSALVVAVLGLVLLLRGAGAGDGIGGGVLRAEDFLVELRDGVVAHLHKAVVGGGVGEMVAVAGVPRLGGPTAVSWAAPSARTGNPQQARGRWSHDR